MTALPSNVYHRCRQILLQCGEFESNASLRAIFVTDELYPFQNGLPEAASKNKRVDACLDFLLARSLYDGQSVLLSFLQVLFYRHPEGDALHDELAKIYAEVAKLFEATRSSADNRQTHLFICYQLDINLDEELVTFLREHLISQGHEVTLDQNMHTGSNWIDEIDRQIKTSDFFVVMLSKESADNEMLQSKVSRAYEYRQLQGRPAIVPVRIAYTDSFPYPIATYLSSLRNIFWYSEADNQRVAWDITAVIAGQLPSQAMTRIEASAGKYFLSEDGRPVSDEESLHPPLPEFDPRFLEILETPGGAVTLRDKFYIEREADTQLKREIVKSGTTTTIQAPRQTGKTSLLMRGVHHACKHGAKVIPIDFQNFGSELLVSINVFLWEIAESICRELHLDEAKLEKFWHISAGVQKKLTYFLEDHVLQEFDEPVVLTMDEADSLLQTAFYKDFFGLVRSWHNRRASHGQWEKLNIVMVISTEPYLLIDDVNQSPFNVGLNLDLADFNEAQVQDLILRHGWLIGENYLPQFMSLLNGHPYLTRKALYILATQRLTWAELAHVASMDQGPFGDHLRRHHWRLRDRPELQDALKQIIHHNRCPDERAAFRLLRAGLVRSDGDVYTCRCGLYRQYFKDKLG